MTEKALVGNVADEVQVKKAERKELSQRDKEIRDLYAVLSTVEGRRVFWRLLSHCKTFESIWRQSAEIHYLSGLQDVGHYLMKEINDCDQDLFFLMMKEAKEEK